MKQLVAWLLVGWLAVEAALGQSFTSSDLPILIIDTQGQSIPDEPKVGAKLFIIDNGPGKRNNLSDKPTFYSRIGIEQRGASSRVLFPKKPYGIELRDSSGTKDLTASVLGLPAEEDWVLNATYNDKTLLREVLTYDIYRRFSPVWATNTRYCEVVLNGRYEGIYILMERTKRDKNRVNISGLDRNDNSGDAVTGGYILKVDKTEGAASRSWTSPYRSNFGPTSKPILIQVDYPKMADITAQQFDYIRKHVTDFENAMADPGYKDPVNGVRRFIDEESFVNYLILTEVCRNVDGYRLSAFFYKDKDSKNGKLTMGPVWDYNLTYGNADYCQGNTFNTWAYDFNKHCPEDTYQIPFWWERLLDDDLFRRKVAVKYTSLRKDVLRTDRLHSYIDSVAATLSESRVRNFQRWPVMGQKIWPNSFVGRTYEEEINFLKTWLRDRLNWMDQTLLPLGSDVLATESSASGYSVQALGNPYTTELTMEYRLGKAGRARLRLVDLTGRTMATFDEGHKAAGSYRLTTPVPPTAGGIQILVLEVNGIPVGRTRLLREG